MRCSIMDWFDLAKYPSRNKILWSLIAGAGVVSIGFSSIQLHTLSHTQLWQFLCLIFVIIFAGRITVALPSSSGAISPTDSLIFLAIFFLGTPAATISAAINGFVASSRINQNKPERIFAACNQAGTTWLASTLMYYLINKNAQTIWHDLSVDSVEMESLLIAAVAMISLYFFLGSFLTAVFQAGKQNKKIIDIWVGHHLWTGLYVFATGFITTIVYVLIHDHSPLYIVLMAPVVAASFATCRNYFAKVEVTSQSLAEISRLHFATVEALATAIDAKDQVTHEHVRRVQIYAEGLGRLFNLPEAEIEALRAGALLHDIGKLAVPDYILNKPGKLSPAEFEKMKIHTTVGARILERVGFPYPVVPIVRYHHERWDGKGYPEGLQGTAIPVTARILSVVDCFDAVREDRSYRSALSRDEACQLVQAQSGRHFDPAVVDTFINHLSSFEAQIVAEGLSIEPKREEFGENSFVNEDIVSLSNSSEDHEYLGQIAAAHHEVSSLYEIARTFSASLDLEDTLSIFVNKLKYIIPFDTCAIYLCEEETKSARIAHAVGKFAEAFASHQIFPGDGVTGWVLANRRMLGNVNPLLDLAGLKIDSENFKTLAVAPLMKGEILIGAIALYAERIERYSSDHLRLLETISGLAADSIYNVLNHAETREYALTDPLTGMPNARALHFQFAQESNRANRQSAPLSVLMMDLDGFKKINDTFGHQAGNEFLIGIAGVISGELRSYDYLARYAGDEFVALLPGATEEDLNDLMWRIQRAVENYKLPVRDGYRIQAGVSLGAARYSLEANSLDRLLRIADRRMYKNKQLRRQHEFLMEAGELGDAVAQVIGRS